MKHSDLSLTFCAQLLVEQTDVYMSNTCSCVVVSDLLDLQAGIKVHHACLYMFSILQPVAFSRPVCSFQTRYIYM